MMYTVRRRSTLALTLKWVFAAAASTALAFAAVNARAATSGLDTLLPGVIKVATRTGSLPYINVEGDSCTGIDCQELEAIARQLGLKVELQPMSFQAALAAVQSRRADMAIGGITWNVARQKTGLFTDPVEYEPLSVIQRPGSDIHTIRQLEGKIVGTVTGFNVIGGLQHVRGVRIRVYDSANAVYADVSNGRLDAGFVGALQDQYVKHLHPALHFVSTPLDITSQEIRQQPAYSVFRAHQNCFYVNIHEPKLEQALTTQIDKLFSSRRILTVVSWAKYGITNPAVILTAPRTARGQRVGVDRPATWRAPSLGYTPPQK